MHPRGRAQGCLVGDFLHLQVDDRRGDVDVLHVGQRSGAVELALAASASPAVSTRA